MEKSTYAGIGIGNTAFVVEWTQDSLLQNVSLQILFATEEAACYGSAGWVQKLTIWQS